MIIVVKRICAEACFQVRPSNKSICCVIFVIVYVDGWLHHNKIFSFKTKKFIVARYEYLDSEDSINNWFIKFFWFCWSAAKITKYVLSKGNSSVNDSFKHST